MAAYPSQAYFTVGDTNFNVDVWEASSGSFVSASAAAYLAWVAGGGNSTLGQATITNVQNNGSGAYRLTLGNGGYTPNGPFNTNDVWVVQGTGTTADGTWLITVINPTTIDLQGSIFGTTSTTGVIDRGVFFSTMAGLLAQINAWNITLFNSATFYGDNRNISLAGGDLTLTNPLVSEYHISTSAAGRNINLPQANLIGSIPFGIPINFYLDFPGATNTVTIKDFAGIALVGPGSGGLSLAFRVVLYDNSTTHGGYDVTPILGSVNGAGRVLVTDASGGVSQPAGGLATVSGGTGATKFNTISVNLGGVNQTGVGSGAFVKVAFSNKVSDPDGVFDAVTNNRYTPNVPGTFLVCAAVCFATNAGGSLADGTICIPSVFKNGSELFRGDQQIMGGAGSPVAQVVAMVPMNGTTDFIELFGFQNSGANGSFVGNPNSLTWMTAQRIGP